MAETKPEYKPGWNRFNVEPILLFYGFHHGVHKAIKSEAIKLRGYEEYAGNANMTLDVAGLNDYVQEQVIYWSIWSSIAGTIAMLITVPMTSAYADKRNRKPIILMGLLFEAASMLFDLCFFCQSLNIPFWVTVPETFIVNLWGATANVQMMAVITDAEQLNRRAMFLRVAFYEITYALSDGLGQLAMGKAADKYISYTLSYAILQVAMPLTMLAAIYLLKDLPPPGLQSIMEYIKDGSKPEKLPIEGDGNSFFKRDGDYYLEQSKEPLNFVHMYKLTWTSMQEFIRKRPNNGRICILIMGAIYFLVASDESESGSLISTYVTFTLDWTASQIAHYNIFSSILSIAAIAAAIIILKMKYNLADGWLLFCGIASILAQYAVLAIGALTHSTSGLLMYIAALVGSFQGITNFAMITTSSRIVEPDEMGRMVSAFALLGSFTNLFVQLVIQNIYRMTLDTFQAAVFIVMAVFSGIAAGLVVVMMKIGSHYMVIGGKPPVNPTPDNGSSYVPSTSTSPA